MAMTDFSVDQVLVRLRAICLALPEAVEAGGVGDPTFKVRDKIFAMRHPMQDRPSLWCKGPPGLQEGLVNAQPDRFFVPPYVGQHGWVGLWLDGDVDWDYVATLVEQSYRMTAPKRLSKLLDGRAS
jgi:predicted DNA-binding protein (MmcQ/YjbR family)